MMEGGDSDPYANPNPANLPAILGAPGPLDVDTTDRVGQALLAALTEGDEDTALRCISQAGACRVRITADNCQSRKEGFANSSRYR